MKRDKDNPIAPLTHLMKRVIEVGKPLGFNVKTFAVLPNEDPDGPHHVQLLAHLTEELPESTKIVDEEFDAIIAGDAKAAQHEKAEQARKELEELKEQLRDPKDGIL